MAGFFQSEIRNYIFNEPYCDCRLDNEYFGRLVDNAVLDDDGHLLVDSAALDDNHFLVGNVAPDDDDHLLVDNVVGDDDYYGDLFKVKLIFNQKRNSNNF